MVKTALPWLTTARVKTLTSIALTGKTGSSSILSRISANKNNP